MHPNQEEHFAIESGRITVHVGGDTDVLGPAEWLTVPAETTHGFENRSDRPVVFTGAFRPGANLVHALSTLSGLAQDGKLRDDGTPRSGRRWSSPRDDGTLEHVRQFGTSGFERALDIAADDEHLYLLGMTSGAFDPTSDPGGTDFFLAKTTHDGEPVWIEQFGTPCTDLASDLVLHDGSLYVAGVSVGEMSDPDATRCTRPAEQQRDTTGYARAFVQARTLDGDLVWTRQFDGHGLNDGDGFSLGITLDVDAAGIYLASEAARTPTPGTIDQDCPLSGIQEDVHVRAYDFDGDERWTQIIGSTTTDNPSGLAVNDGGVFVGGSTDCHLDEGTNQGLADAFVLGIRNGS